MRRSEAASKWLIVAICAILFCSYFAPVVSAARAEEVQPVVYVPPELPSDVDPYDPLKPEELQEEQLYARSAILVEATTGEVIFEKNADEVMYPASTTKILTTLLGIMMGDMNQTVTLSETAADIPSDSSTIKLDVGESINFSDLLYATMIRSGNEGANLIAETISGNINDFVLTMNQAAAMYGCASTNFANPSGLHNPQHYTTARDMAKIAVAAMQNETFRNIVKTYNFNLPRSNIHRARVLVSGADELLNPRDDNEYYYPYANGVKTGFHSSAGYCYVGSAEKDGVQLISVVFYTTENGRWTDTKKLMEYGFSQFMSVTPMGLYNQNPFIIETSGYSAEDEDMGRLRLELRATEDVREVRIVATLSDIETMARNLKQTVLVQYTRDFATPIEQGETMGTLTYYPADGLGAITYELVASRSIQRRLNAPRSLEEIEAAVYADPNPLPPFTTELLVSALVPMTLSAGLLYTLYRLLRKSRRRHKGRVPKPGNRYFR